MTTSSEATAMNNNQLLQELGTIFQVEEEIMMNSEKVKKLMSSGRVKKNKGPLEIRKAIFKKRKILPVFAITMVADTYLNKGNHANASKYLVEHYQTSRVELMRNFEQRTFYNMLILKKLYMKCNSIVANAFAMEIVSEFKKPYPPADPPLPADHCDIDLNSVTTQIPVMLYFFAKTKQLLEIVKTNDFDFALLVVEETLANYQLYTAKDLPQSNIHNIRDTILSFEVCWKLSSSIFKVKTKKLLIEDLEMLEIYQQIEDAYSCISTSKLFCMILEQLLVIFMDKYLMVGANCCIQLLINEKILRGVQNEIDDEILEIETEIKFLLRVFSFSNAVRQDPAFEDDPVRASDIVFNELLPALNVEDYCDLPNIVRGREEAEMLFKTILHKLNAYQSFKQQQLDYLSGDATDHMTLNYFMWNGLAHYIMYFFEEDEEKDLYLLRVATTTFDTIMRDGFNRDQIRYFFVLQPDRVIQQHYRVLLEKNFIAYGILIKRYTKIVMNKSPGPMKILIEQLNILLSNFITVGVAKLHFLDWNEIASDYKKVGLLLSIGSAYRSLISTKGQDLEKCLELSMVYFQRLSKIASTKDFMKKTAKCHHSLVGMTAEEMTIQVDQSDKYITKFRKYFRH